jgi:hypothetical protein
MPLLLLCITRMAYARLRVKWLTNVNVVGRLGAARQHLRLQ